MDLCKRTTYSTLVSRQLHRLYKIPISSRKFAPAFNQFCSSAEYEEVTDNLDDVEVEEFIGFLDEVLRVENLSTELFQTALHSLQNICGKWGILPKSHIISERLSRTGEKEFASGGYAGVWEGKLMEKNSNPRTVCIKAIKVTVREGRSSIEKAFCEEVSVWMRLSHSNVVRCLGATANPPQIVMDLMSNGEVMDYIRRDRNANRVHLVLGFTKGLDYLHSRGVIHGDLKPQNVLVNAKGDACISDFGLAIVTDGVTRHEGHVGRGHNSLCAAPETLKDGLVSKEADVFSYGLVAVEIWKGECPWGRATVAQIMAKITLGRLPARPGGTEAFGLTTELWENLTRCWHTNPEERITISEILELIRSAHPTESVGASGSELPTSGTTVAGAVGTRKSTSIWCIPSSTRDYEPSDPHTPLLTRSTPNNYSGPNGLSEKTVSHLKATSIQEGRGAQTPEGFLKRLLSIPSCTSDRGIAT